MADDELTTGQGAETAAPEKNVAVQESGGAPLVADAAPVPEPAAEPEAPEATEESEQRKPVQKLSPEIYEKKLRQESFEKREAQRRAKELEAEVERLKAAATPAPAAPSVADAETARQNAPAGGYGSKAEFDAAVLATANQRQQEEALQRAEAKFNDDCNAVWTKGNEAFKDDFKQAVANLQSVGAMNRDVLDLVLATEDPSKVLLDLGSDPERAQALLEMTPAKRAVEIAKLAVTPPKKVADPLSNAPAPVRPVEGSARVVGEPRDEDDDAAWFAKRRAQRAECSGAPEYPKM